MARPARASKTGFVIKLSCETTQKLAEEKLQAKDEDVVADNVVEGSDRPVQSENASETVSKHTDAEPAATAVSSTASETRAEWGQYAAHVTYEGEVAVYTDPATNTRYTWDSASSQWQPPPESSGAADTAVNTQYSYENDTHVYTEPDGSKFFYDPDKKAWIPKVDDDFLAFYQMSYGFVDNTQSKKEDSPNKVEKKQEQTGVKRKNDPQWFEASDETNTKVYVSNLPLDMTEQEFVELMSKCGLVERDAASQRMRVRLYMDKERGCFQGDALCSYIKVESVELALKLLDGSNVRGNTISVQRAHFQLKGEYNPALKPKKKKKKELEKLKKMQQKLFDWRPEKIAGDRSKHERVVIIKNLFEPSDFDQEVQLLLEYQADLREECGKVGEVRKVTIYDRHPEGVAQVNMALPEQADAVVALVNGRWFGKRQITAEIWDGRTKYRIAETDADISKRINKWDQFLESGEAGSSTTGDKAAPPAAGDGPREATSSTARDELDGATSLATGVETDEEASSADVDDTGEAADLLAANDSTVSPHFTTPPSSEVLQLPQVVHPVNSDKSDTLD